MRFFSLLLLCSLLCSANVSLAQEGTGASPPADVVISTGLEGGGYWKAGNRLIQVAAEMGLNIANETSTGSVNNLRALMNGGSPVSLAFAQADALAYHLKNRPDSEKSLAILENIGEECVFILSHADSKISTDEDMQEKRQLNLGIRSPNSGIRVTFDYMSSLVPELKKLSVSYGNTVDMMDNFATPRTDVEAVMVVHAPNEISPEITRVMANPDQFQFVKIRDKRLLEMTYRGKPIYHKRKVVPGAVDGARKVETICVNGLLLANTDKLTPEQRAILDDITFNHWEKVYPTGE